VLVIAFILSGVLEVVGVGLVFEDFRRERRAVRQLLDVPVTEQVELDGSNVRKYPGSTTVRKQQLEQDAEIDQASETAELVRTVLLDLVRPHYRRLVGPILIALGIVIATVASIVALE
jgi:hypothetical protein